MKNQTGNHAIYATPRRVYFVQPNATVPNRNARLVISHADGDALAWAFDKSTHGDIDGKRVPGHAQIRYPEYAEQVLARVLGRSWRKYPITEAGLNTLRHLLGSKEEGRNGAKLGWRNYFVSAEKTEELEKLEADGLIERVEFKTVETATMTWTATIKGMIVAGLSDERIAEVTGKTRDWIGLAHEQLKAAQKA